MNTRFSLPLLFLFITGSLFQPSIFVVHAAPLTQEGDTAPLSVINESRGFIFPVFANDSWGDDRLVNDEVILPGEIRSCGLLPGNYDVELTDCDGNKHLDRRNIILADQDTLRFASPDLCDALHQEGVALYRQAKYQDAIQKFQEALSCYRNVNDRQGEGTALNNIGHIYYYLGSYAEALDYFEQALAIFREIGERKGEGSALNDIGYTYSSLGSYTEALDYYEQALAIFREVGDREGEGTALNNIGGIYYSLGPYTEALDYLEQALPILREIGDHEGEGNTLNGIGYIYSSRGSYTEALDYFEQSLTISREIGNREGEGITLNGIGEVYLNLGSYAEALNYFEQSLTISREIGDRAEEGITLNNIGLIYTYQGSYAEALDYFEQALTILREVGDRAGEGGALNNIGNIYLYLGSYAEALDYYQQALTISREIGDRAGEGTVLNGIGSIYSSLGSYAEALDSNEQSLTILREVGDREGEGNALNNIGVIYEGRGDYAQALDYFEQVLTIRREIGDREGEGATLNNIGMIYIYLRSYAEALDYCEQSLTISRQVGNRQGEGTVLSNIGGIYLDLGSYAEALDYYEQALTIRREVGDREGEGIDLSNIGVVYENLGDYTTALDYSEQALTVLREVGDRVGEGATMNRIGSIYIDLEQYEMALDYSEQALTISREIGDRGWEGTALNNIGLIYVYQGWYAEALDYYKQALTIYREVDNRQGEGSVLNNIGLIYERLGDYTKALEYYQQAMTVLESIRATAGSETRRASFISQYADLYDDAISIYHDLGQDADAFYTSERGRSRAFLDALATGYVQLSDTAADLYAREVAANNRIQAVQHALIQARAQSSPDEPNIADLEAQLAEAEAEHVAALDAIAARGDQLASLVPGRSTVLDLSQVQMLLDDQTTLVAYWVLQTDNRVLAFVITRDALHTVAVDVPYDDMVAAISDFRNFASLQNAHPESMVQLYNWLIGPLKEYITTPQLTIIPNDVLHYLPFAALTDGNRFLVEDYVITYLPSASALPFIQQNARHVGEAPLILGNPTTGEYDIVTSFTTERDGLGPLPFAEREAQSIAALYGVPAHIGPAATESLVRQSAGETSVLHLAAHGNYNTVAPLQSFIALAPDADHDGWLTVGEIYSLDLQRANLVVLSACETQLGDLSQGDELVGMTRAFLYAGTPTVVASLWSVDDAATAQLMERFYVHLQAGLSKAEALHQAQLDIQAEYPNPYYWAGFVLSGDGGKVSLDAPGKPVSRWLWLGGSATLCGSLTCFGAVGLLLILLWVTRKGKTRA